MGDFLERLIETCREHKWVVVAALIAMVAVAAILTQLSGGPEKFPASSTDRITIHTPSRLSQILPAAPSQPTVSELTLLEPTTVPGLDAVAWAKSPTLSADLLTIVFVRFNPEGSGEDLWIAERESIQSPFSRPAPIASVNSNENDTHPSLTPDGLELSFIRMATPFQWRIATRESRNGEFSGSTVIDTAELVKPTLQVEYVHQISSTRGLLGMRNSVTTTPPTDVTESKCLFYTRRHAKLTSLERSRIANQWPRYICSANRSRLYYSDKDGLHVSARATLNSEFVLPEQLVSSDDIGGDASRFDSTIWLSPKEDLLVYCAPRRDQESQQDNLLWMMRIR